MPLAAPRSIASVHPHERGEDRHGGIREFAREVVKPMLRNEFDEMRVLCSADPAGNQHSQVDETTCIAEVNNQGIPCEPAPTNAFLARRQAVISFLTRNVEGGPGFILDPSCTILRKGFNGGYHFSRVQVIGEEKHRDVPNKNAFSHPHDALQYAALAADREVAGAATPVRASCPVVGGWQGFVQ